MSISRMAWGWSSIVVVALSAGCGGGDGMSGSSTTQTKGYNASYLVADTAAAQMTYGAAHVDASLTNPWGIAFAPDGFVWVSNQRSSTTTLYDGNGVAYAACTGCPLAIAVSAGTDGRGGPTGVLYNSSISGGSGSFVLPDSEPAQFIYATIGGTIEGWDNASGGTTQIKYDGGAAGAVYTGLALGHDSNGNYFLYAADFGNGTVDVFDQAFNPITAAGGFNTPTGVPAGFVPYGIQNIPAANGTAQIYVAYAQSNTTKTGTVAAAGAGYVAVFDDVGNLIKLLISGGSLNAPWGMALAPANFGTFGGALLVGNFGDGSINAYNSSTGALMGTLTESSGAAVHIPGLWGIAFGNGVNSQPTNTLFFAAGVNSEVDGVYGRIDYGAPASTGGGGGY